MLNRKTILLGAALAMTAAAVFAGEIAYKEAAAPWSAEQAARIPPALTAAVIEKFGTEYGTAAATALSVKKTAVSALVNRLKACDLNAGDVRTAEKYLTPEFKAEVLYFANGGCEASRAAAAGTPADTAQSASLSTLKGASAGGTLSTYRNSSKFFDGSSGRDTAPVPAHKTGAGDRAYKLSPAPAPKPLSANVPALTAPPAANKTEHPADIGKNGRVNSILSYWNAQRRENWAIYKKDGVSRAEKARALLKAAAGAGLCGLLLMSNLPQIEIAAMRLGWDAGHGAGAGVIAMDSARLAFHSGVSLLLVQPIPLTEVARGVLACKAWAIALAGAMGAGPVNQYLLHIF